MDQGSLVTEQIDAGLDLIGEFGKILPLQTAFWVKNHEDGEWLLYLVSDQINDSNLYQAYGEVLKILGEGPHVWLNPFQIKVRSVVNPTANAVIALQQQYPMNGANRLRNLMLGDIYADDLYIYPIDAPIPA
jgi:hypothetical protein